MAAKKLSYFEKLPLPPNYFKCPPLTPDETKQLLFLADSMCMDVVDYATLDDAGPLDWTLESNDCGLFTYKTNDPNAPRGTRSWLWTTKVQGTLAEVAAMFNPAELDDPVEYREHCRAFHMDALDGVRLYTLETPSASLSHGESGQYVGVHWTVNELPGLLKNKDVCVVKNRDWCFLESHAPIVLGDGRHGWVRALSSIELHCCPDLKPSLGFIRANYHRSGYVFAESRDYPGFLDVTQLQQIDFRGTLTDLVAAIEVAERKRDMRELQHKLTCHRLSQMTFLAEYQLVPSQSRNKCRVCLAKFGVLVHRHRCRKCGEVVCSKCSKVWPIKVAGIHSNVRVCTPCAMCVKRPPSSCPNGVLRRGTSTFAGMSTAYPREPSDLDETASIASSSRASVVSSESGAKLRRSHRTLMPPPLRDTCRLLTLNDDTTSCGSSSRDYYVSTSDYSRHSDGDDDFSRYSDTAVGEPAVPTDMA
ncbi:hypothetical protein DYB32_010231, partial [Aphanomyces invadans]